MMKMKRFGMNISMDLLLIDSMNSYIFVLLYHILKTEILILSLLLKSLEIIQLGGVHMISKSRKCIGWMKRWLQFHL